MAFLLAVLPGVHRVGDGLHQNVAAKEILVVQARSLLVGRIVHHQGAHHAATVLHAVAGSAVDVGQEAVAQADGLEHGIVGPVALLAELIQLADHGRGAVVAHQGHESAPLHPTGLQLLHGRVLRTLLILPVEEAAEVRVPKRNAAERIVQARGHLVLHLVPGSHDVAAPRERAVVLDAEAAAARHLQRAFPVALHRTLVLIDALVVEQGEGILHAEPRSVVGLPVLVAHLLEMVGFGRVGPPGVQPHPIEVGEVFPVEVARLGVEDIVGLHTGVAGPRVKRQQGVHLLQFLVLFRPRTEVGPNGDHQVGIVLVDVLHHFLGTLQSRLALRLHVPHVAGQILIVGRVTHLVDVVGILKLHRVPVGVAAPILPVLHDGIGGNPQRTVLVEHTGQFVAGLVAFTALPESH